MPRTDTRKKRKEKRRKKTDPLEQAKKARSRKAQAKKGKNLYNTSLSNKRGRTRERGKPGARNASLSRTVSEKRAAAAAAARLLQKPVKEVRPSFPQAADYSKRVSSVGLPQATGKTAGKRRAQKGKPRKKSVNPTLSLTQSFVRNQIDDTTNIAADQRSMGRIFQNSQPMLASTVPTRKSMAGKRGENQAMGPSDNRTAVESGISISPVFQCRAAINSIINQIGNRANWLSSVPYGFTMTSGGQSGAMAANVMNSGVTINQSQWRTAFENEFGNREKRRREPYALTPPPDPRILDNGEYIIQSRQWKLRYSWMTMLPLLWGVDPNASGPPLHCEHKLPLFWLAAFGCGPETKLAIFSNIDTYTGIVEDIKKNTGESVQDIRTKIQDRMGVGAISDMSSLEGQRTAEDIAMRRARVSEEYVAVKHTVREECYAWEFPCVNSAIKSQMVFINLILVSGQLYYVIANQAISNYVEGLARGGIGEQVSQSCVIMWYTILMNILLARGVNIGNWQRISEAVGISLEKPKDVKDLIQRAASSGGEGIIGLADRFLSDRQKRNIPRGQYTKKYIYDSMVIQLLKLTSLLNNTVNNECKWGSTLPDGGIRNNLYLNYIRLKRFCETSDRYATKVGAIQDSAGHWNQPTTGMFTMLRNLRNNNAGLRQAANRYIAQIRNANGPSVSIPQVRLIQRGGSLIFSTGSGNLDLGNSNFSMAVNDAADAPIDIQARVDDNVDVDAQNLLTGYEASGESSSGSSSAESSPSKGKSPAKGKVTPQKSSSGSHRNLQFSSASESSSPPRYMLSTPQQQQYYKSPGTGYRGEDESSPQRRNSIRRQDSIIQRQETIGDGYMGDESQDPFSSQFSQGFSQGGGKKKKKKKTKKKKRRRRKRTRRK